MRGGGRYANTLHRNFLHFNPPPPCHPPPSSHIPLPYELGLFCCFMYIIYSDRDRSWPILRMIHSERDSLDWFDMWYTVTGISVIQFAMWFPTKIGPDLSRSQYIFFLPPPSYEKAGVDWDGLVSSCVSGDCVVRGGSKRGIFMKHNKRPKINSVCYTRVANNKKKTQASRFCSTASHHSKKKMGGNINLWAYPP